ncbi:hypothetical protein BFF78_02565 [Streptomyces fodineus]|uniref:Peptidoglycan binding-like domain-containing protein n=2 Tax=Streptomyces fodineus TaxID=1904616 RepID=A0A1D7Y3C7_9ACTN|nr:hypothetical protein BFF78_02565 [Streptomyces fodineus]
MRRHGGTVHTGVRITDPRRLPPADTTLLDLDPGQVAALYRDRLPARVRGAYQRFRRAPAVFKLDLAVEGGVPWTNGHARRAGTVHLGGPLAEVARGERGVVAGRMPERPFVRVGQQYPADPSRSAGDVHPVYTYAHVPYGYDGDATEAILRQLEPFAPGVRDRVVGSRVTRPASFAAANPDFAGGDIIIGAKATPQVLLGTRPTTAPYSTGTPGVLLCSAVPVPTVCAVPERRRPHCATWASGHLPARGVPRSDEDRGDAITERTVLVGGPRAELEGRQQRFVPSGAALPDTAQVVHRAVIPRPVEQGVNSRVGDGKSADTYLVWRAERHSTTRGKSMRTNIPTRALLTATTAVALAAGSLAAAGTSVAAPAAAHPAVSTKAVTPQAVNNLGLNATQAKKVQRWLKQYWRYTGSIDGQLGPNSWKAFQRCLKQYWGYTGPIDGVVGTGTVKALQRLLKDSWGYTGAIDGIAGSGTKAAFKRFADAH